MCLYIESHYHAIDNDGKEFKPHVAKQPILVWKFLETGTEKSANSPFQNSRWIFGQPRKAKFTYSDDNTAVEAGLHAMITKRSDRFDGWWATYGSYYPAVIPAGTKFWIGENNEIVAEEMIAYHDEMSCLAAYGATKFAPGIPRRTYKHKK
jgi:exoribonuclease II